MTGWKAARRAKEGRPEVLNHAVARGLVKRNIQEAFFSFSDKLFTTFSSKNRPGAYNKIPLVMACDKSDVGGRREVSVLKHPCCPGFS